MDTKHSEAIGEMLLWVLKVALNAWMYLNSEALHARGKGFTVKIVSAIF